MVQKGMLMNIAGLAAGAWIGDSTIIDDIQNIDTSKFSDQITNLALAAGSILAVKFLKLKGMMVVLAYVAGGYFLGQAVHGMVKPAAVSSSYSEDYFFNAGTDMGAHTQYIAGNPYNV